MWAFSWSFTLAFTWWNFKPLIFVRTAMWSIRASSPLLKLIRDIWQLISTWIGSSFCACDQIHSDGDQSDKWKDKFLDQERRQNSSSNHGSRLILPSIDLCPFAGVFVKPEGMAMLAQDKISSSAFCGCTSVRSSHIGRVEACQYFHNIHLLWACDINLCWATFLHLNPYQCVGNVYFNLVPWQTCSQQGCKVMPWHISAIIIWPKEHHHGPLHDTHTQQDLERLNKGWRHGNACTRFFICLLWLC